ncbi:heparin lyase I family protein [Actinomycetospora endophytica]|uniref:Heparin lyase I family protein n=1 Tax=Actinomycetospora endophytica TaxID=2291215 RepID=A0ABS8PDU7_9PSEU|nr:polysaccharide lyase [Actinomycetospora endophytica]MCD2196455.1 heparin lyase I family protein [Actinomycetospora endophytica]
MSRPADLVDDLSAEPPTVSTEAPTVDVTEPAVARLRASLEVTDRRHEPLAPRPLSPHAGPGARPEAGPDPARARRRRRAALIAGAGALLAAVLGLAASATAVPTGESWGAELAVSGGDDVNVHLADGAVRLVAPSTARKRSEGVMVLAPRRPAAPTNAITSDLTADLPPGTAARVDVRGVLPNGSWSRWIPTRNEERTVLPSATTQVQARIVLLGGSGAVSPAVDQLWLTTSTTTAVPETATAPVAPSTTAVPPPVKPGGTKPAPAKPGDAKPGDTKPGDTKPSPAKPTPTTARPPASGPLGLPGLPQILSTPDPNAPDPNTPSTAVSTVPTKAPEASATKPSTSAPSTSSAAPTTTPTTPAPAIAPVVKAIWDSDITAQSLGMFKDTPWNFVGAKQPTVVPATDLPGQKALKFTMPGGAKRAEIEPNVDNFTEGQDRYIRMTVRLAPGFPTDTDTWQLITQFKNDGDGSPPLELRIGKGNYILSGGADAPGGSKNFDQTIAPAVVGKVTTLVLHVKFSSNKSEGVVDAWVDGQKKVTGFHPPAGTLYSGDFSYWKLGLYRDTSIDQAATYELSDARVGDSYASVAG